MISEKANRENKEAFKLVIIASTVLAIIIIFWIAAQRKPFHQDSFCLKDGSGSTTAVIVDLTEPRDENQISEIMAWVKKAFSMKSLYEHEQFATFIIPGEVNTAVRLFNHDDTNKSSPCRPPTPQMTDHLIMPSKTISAWKEWENDFLNKKYLPKLKKIRHREQFQIE
jgi:hypothetical protein